MLQLLKLEVVGYLKSMVGREGHVCINQIGKVSFKAWRKHRVRQLQYFSFGVRLEHRRVNQRTSLLHRSARSITSRSWLCGAVWKYPAKSNYLRVFHGKSVDFLQERDCARKWNTRVTKNKFKKKGNIFLYRCLFKYVPKYVNIFILFSTILNIVRFL